MSASIPTTAGMARSSRNWASACTACIRTEDARRLFDKLAGLCNDVGLLAEEYLPRERQQIGNFPQAFSHLALVNCAYTLAKGEH